MYQHRAQLEQSDVQARQAGWISEGGTAAHVISTVWGTVCVISTV